MFKIILIFLLLLTGSTSLWSQTPTITKLSNQYHAAQSSAEKRNVLIELLQQYRSINRDSLYFFSQELKSMNQSEWALENELEANYYLIYYYSYKGLIDSCFSLLSQGLEMAEDSRHAEKYRMMFTFSRAGMLIKIGKPQDALIWSFSAMPIAQSIADTAFQIKILNLIGWSYMEMNLFKESANWFNKALSFTEAEKYSYLFPYIYANIASSYGGMNQIDSATHYIQLALKEARKHDDYFSLANSLAIMANIQFEKGKREAAIDTMLLVLDLRKTMQDPLYELADMVLLSEFYGGAGRADEGIALAKKAIKLARDIGSTNRLQMAYHSLASNYEAKGDFHAAITVLKKQLQLSDSLAKSGVVGELAELQTKFKNAKTDKELAILEAKASAQELQLQQEQNARRITLVSVLAMVLASFTFWFHFNQKSKAKMQKDLLKAIFETEQKERLRIARDLHDSIGQLLSVVKIQVSNLKTTQPAEIPSNINQTIGLVDKTIQEVRDISHNLIPVELNFGLVAALDDLIDTINESPQTQAIFQHQNIKNYPEPDRSLSLTIYRIVQEVISNMLRHSGAHKICITLDYVDRGIQLNIKDDGKGFDVEELQDSSGIGWKNINARLQLLNAKIEVWSENNKGTHIEILIPHGGAS